VGQRKSAGPNTPSLHPCSHVFCILPKSARRTYFSRAYTSKNTYYAPALTQQDQQNYDLLSYSFPSFSQPLRINATRATGLKSYDHSLNYKLTGNESPSTIVITNRSTVPIKKCIFGQHITYEESTVKLVVRVLKSGTVLYKTHAHTNV